MSEQSETSVIAALLEANLKLTDKLIELTREVLELRASAPAPVPMEVSRFPLQMAETEEDAMHLFRTGQIDQAELEDTLKEIGFLNAELTIPGQ